MSRRAPWWVAALAVVAGVASVLLVIPALNTADEKLTLATPDPTEQIDITATVIDDGTGPRFCYLILTSDPPQCGGGLPLEKFSWDDVTYDEGGDIRWGDYDLVGTYDGSSFALTEKPMPGSPPSAAASPTPVGDPTPFEIKAIIDDVRAELGDGLIGWGEGDGYASLNVYYDDGSLQQQLDARYGPGATVLIPILGPTG